jgi:hypothetical protein
MLACPAPLLVAFLACTAATAAAAAACDSFTSEAACAAAACVWCLSAAVPPACYTPADAARLPPGVFACKKEKDGVQEWLGVS